MQTSLFTAMMQTTLTVHDSVKAPKEQIYWLLGLPTPWRGNEAWASTESGQLLYNKYGSASEVRSMIREMSKLHGRHIINSLQDSREMA